ncbi:MAG TPA: metallo-dependent hydrolase [Candidatus Methylomirabilis sp.]|nr:metallo-dependent hydrolase [Candidatus Methylomirabilis sp.]
MRHAVWIRGGVLVDPARNLLQPGDVLIRGDRIIAAPAGDVPDAEQVIDAAGCLVLPGLIDFHSHLYPGGSEIGIPPDASLLPMGVTTAVDAGSAGVANYELFSRAVIARSLVRIKSFLNVAPTGLVTTRYPENVDPKYFDPEKTGALLKEHRGELLGLKIRQSRSIVGALGLEPLRAAVRMAEQLTCPVVVHTTDPPGSPSEIADLLRPGDIFCHVFHGTGNTIIGPDGGVLPGILAARKRGVLFDAANGRNHFAFPVAEAAIRQSFLPDVISTDLSAGTLFREPIIGLPHVMSKYLAMGVSLMEVVGACTSIPARLLAQQEEIGTLAPGACADVVVMQQMSRRVEFVDARGERREGRVLLAPRLTLRAGRVVFRQIDF